MKIKTILINFKKKIFGENKQDKFFKPYYRKVIPQIYKVFFVISMPLILILSTGYLASFSTISSSATIELETYPYFADRYINDVKINTFSNEIKTEAGSKNTFKFSKENYFDFNLTTYSKEKINSFYKTSGLNLLPKNFITSNSNIEIVKELNDNNIIYKNKDGLAVGSVATDRVKLIGLINGKDVNFLLNKIDKIGFINNALTVENEALIFKNENGIFEKKAIEFTGEVLSILDISESGKILFKTKNSSDNYRLYSYDIVTKTSTLVSDNLPNYYYDLIEKKLYVKSDKKIDTYLVTGDNVFAINTTGESQDISKSDIANGEFSVTPAYYGKIIKTGSTIYYIKETNNEDNPIFKIAENCINFYSFDDKIIILTKNNILFFNLTDNYYYNILEKDIENVEDSKVYFSKEKNRIFVYSGKDVRSTYFNYTYNYNIANSFVVYSDYDIWISDENCLNKLINNIQFCSRNNNDSTYSFVLRPLENLF